MHYLPRSICINLSACIAFAANPLAFGQQIDHAPVPSAGFDHTARREYFSGLFATGTVTYRDFATSPLFYSGPGFLLSTALYDRSARRDQQLDLQFGFYSAFDNAPKSNVLNNANPAVLSTLQLYYHHLFQIQIKSVSTENWNFKAGPSIIITQNIRLNPGLFNNGLGLENISNVMASGLVTRNISRSRARDVNFYLFKIHLPRRSRELRMQLNAGVLNFNFRPGYAYSYDAEIIGTQTNPVEWALANYRLSVNGWRLQSHIEWLWYLHNGNGFSLKYHWDAFHAPGRFEPFQMAVHNVGFAYYFERKIRRIE